MAYPLLKSKERDGEDGYLAYLHFRPDIVITDIQVPIKDGFQLMKDIKIPILVAAGRQVHATGKNNDEGETPLSSYLPFLAATYNTGVKNHDEQEKIALRNELAKKIAEFRRECMREFERRCNNGAGGSL